MHIVHLSLTNFRNYTQLELDFPPQHVVIHGENAQGKTNLLEAIYLLSTTKSYRTSNEKELVSWAALKEANAVTRVSGNFIKEQGAMNIEIALRFEENGLTQKRIKVNDLPFRASEVVGQANMIMFEAEDSQLTCGPAAMRRRYLDLMISQIDHRYLHSLQQYNRVLTQRNHLLRLISEGQAKVDQMDFWDKELVQNGVYLIRQRQKMINGMNEFLLPLYQKLCENEDSLQIKYLPRIGSNLNLLEPEEILIKQFQESLQKGSSQEIGAGITLTGPHRDDMRFIANNIDIGVYGSRGQQRITVLAIKLAQAEYSKAQTGEYPVMLLDDVLSELDNEHRDKLLEMVAALPQIFITTTDISTISPVFLSRSVQLKISHGTVTQL